MNSLGDLLVGALKFLINSPDKPQPVIYRHLVTFGVREATVIHKEKGVL